MASVVDLAQERHQALGVLGVDDLAAHERHGGRIWVESNAPHGTRMRFTLPA